jgi:predicted RND superfamily exporter protein
LAQLALEEALEDAKVQEVIVTSAVEPTGITSPALLITQGAFLNEAMEVAAPHMGGGNGSSDVVAGTVFQRMATLSLDERRTIIEGGDVELELPGLSQPLLVTFGTYDPSMVPSYVDNTPFEEVLPFLLSKDFASGDGRVASKGILSITVENDIEEDRSLEIEHELEYIASDIEGENEGLELRLLGNAVVNEEINEASGASIGIIMTAAVILIVVVLAIVYRNGRDTVFNLLALLFAIIWVYGFGALMGFNFNPMTTTVPVLILGLGIDYGIHMTLRYREEIRKGKDIPSAMGVAGSTVGFAISVATLTTILGFMSNVTADVSAIREFGILAAFGILSAFIMIMTFFPAVKVIADQRRLDKGKPILREKKAKVRDLWGWARRTPVVPEGAECPVVCSSGVSSINNVLGTGAVVARRPVMVLVVLVILTLSATWGATQLESRFGFRDFLPEDLEVSESFDMLFDEFDFSRESAFVLAEGDVEDPQVFRAVEDAQERTLSTRHVVLTEPIESPLELARSMATPGPNFNPQFAPLWTTHVDKDGDGSVDADIGRSNVTAVYTAMHQMEPNRTARVLHANGDGFDGLVIRVPVNSRNGEVGEELTEDMDMVAAPLVRLEGDELKAAIATGSAIVSYQVQESISTGQMRSLLIITIVSLLILTSLYVKVRRSLALGIITLLPMLFVIVWGFGGMFAVGVPFNVVTVTIAAITVGIGIDYGIHVTQRFLEDLDTLKEGDCALCVSVTHTGTALFGSAATTVVGFGLLSLSIIPPLSQFGTVTALNIIFAFVASVFVLPTFLMLWHRGKGWLTTRGRHSAMKSSEAPEA